MTRRPKRSSESDDHQPEVRKTRESLLRASAAAGSTQDRRARAPAPEPPAVAPPTTDVVADQPTSTSPGGEGYMSLTDLQRHLSNGDEKEVKTTLFNDGENSFLRFTFTVRLDSKTGNTTATTGCDVITSDRAPDDDDNVIAGTVNISGTAAAGGGGSGDAVVTSSKSAPVVSVGLQRGGVLVSGDGKTSTITTEKDNENVAAAGKNATDCCKMDEEASTEVKSLKFRFS